MTNKEQKYLNIAIDILIELQGTVDSDKLDSGIDLLIDALADAEEE